MAGVSKSTDKFVNVFVCVGAAVVIFGAWAKDPSPFFCEPDADRWSVNRSTDIFDICIFTASRSGNGSIGRSTA